MAGLFDTPRDGPSVFGSSRQNLPSGSRTSMDRMRDQERATSRSSAQTSASKANRAKEATAGRAKAASNKAAAGPKLNTRAINKHAAAIAKIDVQPSYMKGDAHKAAMGALKADKGMKAADKVALANKLGLSKSYLKITSASHAMSEIAGHAQGMLPRAAESVRSIGTAASRYHGGGGVGLAAPVAMGLGLAFFSSMAGAATPESVQKDEAKAAGDNKPPPVSKAELGAGAVGAGLFGRKVAKQGLGAAVKQTVNARFNPVAALKGPAGAKAFSQLSTLGKVGRVVGRGSLAGLATAAVLSAYQGYQEEGVRGALKGAAAFIDPSAYGAALMGEKGPGLASRAIDAIADRFGGAKAGSGNPTPGVAPVAPAAPGEAVAKVAAPAPASSVMAGAAQPHSFMAANERYGAMQQAKHRAPAAPGKHAAAKGKGKGGPHHVWTDINRQHAAEARKSARASF